MIYRKPGKTGIKVSAVALGCKGFAGKTRQDAQALMDCAIANGVDFIDLYASEPELCSTIGAVLRGWRKGFVMQGHIGSVWKNGQYERTRDVAASQAAFADLPEHLETDYLDVGMIHYCDQFEDFRRIFDGEFIKYAKELKAAGKIRSIWLSSHNPAVAKMAVPVWRKYRCSPSIPATVCGRRMRT